MNKYGINNNQELIKLIEGYNPLLVYKIIFEILDRLNVNMGLRSTQMQCYDTPNPDLVDDLEKIFLKPSKPVHELVNYHNILRYQMNLNNFVSEYNYLKRLYEDQYYIVPASAFLAGVNYFDCSAQVSTRFIFIGKQSPWIFSVDGEFYKIDEDVYFKGYFVVDKPIVGNSGTLSNVMKADVTYCDFDKQTTYTLAYTNSNFKSSTNLFTKTNKKLIAIEKQRLLINKTADACFDYYSEDSVFSSLLNQFGVTKRLFVTP